MERARHLCEQIPVLAGHRIGVTGDRRSDEQCELLRRMGAEVIHGPVLRVLPLADDAPMRAATAALLDEPPSMLLVTTGIGLRAWVGAAETWGLADALLDLLAGTAIHVRGPKAYGAAAQLGLPVLRREPSERFEAMVDWVTTERLDGQHVAVQLFGNDAPWALKALREAGAKVTAIPVYRWVPPDDEGPARRLVREALDGQLTVVTFTSPSAVASICRIAEAEGSLDALLVAFRTRVVAACVGPATAEAARDRGIEVACFPDVGRLGLLVRSLAATLGDRHVHLRTGDRELVVQSSLVVGDDVRVVLPDRERQVLAAIASRAGRVASRVVVEREVWGSADEDRALDAVLSRLRRRLLPTGLEIVTRVRRGYQLLAEPIPCPAAADRADGLALAR
jgi:uroporphyrinogen-III synthase